MGSSALSSLEDLTERVGGDPTRNIADSSLKADANNAYQLLANSLLKVNLGLNTASRGLDKVDAALSSATKNLIASSRKRLKCNASLDTILDLVGKPLLAAESSIRGIGGKIARQWELNEARRKYYETHNYDTSFLGRIKTELIAYTVLGLASISALGSTAAQLITSHPADALKLLTAGIVATTVIREGCGETGGGPTKPVVLDRYWKFNDEEVKEPLEEILDVRAKKGSAADGISGVNDLSATVYIHYKVSADKGRPSFNFYRLTENGKVRISPETQDLDSLIVETEGDFILKGDIVGETFSFNVSFDNQGTTTTEEYKIHVTGSEVSTKSDLAGGGLLLFDTEKGDAIFLYEGKGLVGEGEYNCVAWKANSLAYCGRVRVSGDKTKIGYDIIPELDIVDKCSVQDKLEDRSIVWKDASTAWFMRFYTTLNDSRDINTATVSQLLPNSSFAIWIPPDNDVPTKYGGFRDKILEALKYQTPANIFRVVEDKNQTEVLKNNDGNNVRVPMVEYLQAGEIGAGLTPSNRGYRDILDENPLRIEIETSFLTPQILYSEALRELYKITYPYPKTDAFEGFENPINTITAFSLVLRPYDFPGELPGMSDPDAKTTKFLTEMPDEIKEKIKIIGFKSQAMGELSFSPPELVSNGPGVYKWDSNQKKYVPMDDGLVRLMLIQ